MNRLDGRSETEKAILTRLLAFSNVMFTRMFNCKVPHVVLVGGSLTASKETQS
jgi:hypothetical protein